MTLIDYPSKVAAIVFTIGCNFRCKFCYNTRLVDPKLFKTNEIVSEDVFLDFLRSRVNKLEAVVITGGEPTLQSDLEGFIKKIKKLGFLVKLDTNGTNPKILKELLDQKIIDYVAMDIKNELNKEAYNKIVGVSNINNIKKSIDILMSSNIDYEFRTTVAPGITVSNIINISKYIKGSNRYYLQKFQDTDILDKKCKKEKWLNEDELEKILDKIKNLFNICGIR